MSTSDSAKCNDAVYKYGECVGVYAWSKDEAESYRRRATNSQWLYDWHFSGGRVVMLRIRRGPFASVGRFLKGIARALDR